MKTKDYEARATQDITISELPKQDNPNNSDLLVIQGSSLTEATSIQQLRDKILGGGISASKGLGETVYSLFPLQDETLLKYDGTQYSNSNYQQFYNFILAQNSQTQSFFSLDTVAGTFKLPNLTGLYNKVAFSNPAINTTLGLPSHTHSIAPHSHTINPHSHSSSLPAGGGSGSIIENQLYKERYDGNNKSYGTNAVSLTTNNNTGSLNTNNHNLTNNDAVPYYTQYVYCRVLEEGSSIVSTPYIKSDGSVSMNLDYTPTDIQDVATKRYIDNKFLNYEVPLSFSINELGKRVQYYKGIETNPTLIALDGTKYLISDYPDFDYLQYGFSNDGVYFWYSVLDLDIKLIMASTTSYDLEHNGYIRISITNFPIIFNSKLVYNFLQTPQGANLLVADGVGKDKDNFGFTILDASTYQIRMNTVYPANEYGRLIYGGYGMKQTNKKGAINFIGATGELPITEGQYLLKIQPDYMAAKIQQVGGSDNIVISDDVNFNGFKVTNLGTPVNGTDSARLVDLNSNNVIITTSVADSKVVKTLTTKLTEVDTSISTNSNNVSNLQNKINPIFCSSRKLTQQNTNNKTLAGQATYRPIDFCNIISAGGYENSLSFIKQGTTNSVLKETNMVNGFQRQLVIGVSLGHNNTMASKKIECSVVLKRGDGTIVRGGNSMIFYDTQTRLQTSTTMTVTLDNNDNFVTQGWYLEIQNLNPAADILTFSLVDILINVVQLPKLAGA